MPAPAPQQEPGPAQAPTPGLEPGLAEAPAAPRPADQAESQWLREVYAGDDQPQLTLRAVVMGSALGVVMAFSNVYIGLRMGFSLGVAITACVLSYTAFRLAPMNWMQAPRALRLFDRHRDLQVSILENNCVQSTASAAGFSTGAVLTSGLAAYLMVTGHHPPAWAVAALVFCLASLGVFLAVPMKRQMINVERLPFPSGTAAAETLRSLHAAGAEAALKARALFAALGAGALVAWLRDGQPRLAARFGAEGLLARLALPDFVPIHDWLRQLGHERAARLADPAGCTLSLQVSSIAAAAGALMGLRVAASMLLGAVLNYAILAPWLLERGAIRALGYRGIVAWSVWFGVAVLSSAALASFFWEWRTLARAFSGLAALGRRRPAQDPLARIEVPGSWFLAGAGLATLGCVLINRAVFGVPVALGLLAVALSMVMALVACRATGETDVTPTGPLGKITQLIFGVLSPQNPVANLMGATTTAGAAASSADLLTDLKAGYLLGANPRKQFLAQFFGVVVGTGAATAAFFALVPDASALGGDQLPAPAAQVWRAVSHLLAQGLSALPPMALPSLWVGAGVGILLTLCDKLLPRARRFLPSAVGLGLAFTFQGFLSISFFLGALAAEALRRARPEAARSYTVPVASGLIAGESMAGVAVAFLRVAGLL